MIQVVIEMNEDMTGLEVKSNFPPNLSLCASVLSQGLALIQAQRAARMALEAMKNEQKVLLASADALPRDGKG